MHSALTRPELTLPEAEAAALRASYARASVILEYGSGGSTLVAAEAAGKTVFSVESDAAWAAMMLAWFAANPPAATVHVHGVDIGPTRQWGLPRDDAAFRRWPDYPLSVWDRSDFQHPDVVLIDGRFRPACLLATAFRISRPVTVLFDDYATRDRYHQIERVLKPAAMHGRIAEFQVAPMAVSPEQLAWVIGFFLRPM